MKQIQNINYIGKRSIDGLETCALGFGQNDCDVVVRNCKIDAGSASWGLKLPKCYNMLFENCVITNGYERALDIVRGGEIVFKGCNFYSNNGQRKPTTSLFKLDKTCDIGIKAGARDIKFINCFMSDILLGDYSIYDQIDRPKTRRITLINCKNGNGGPIFIRGFHVDTDSINIISTNAKIFIYPQWITAIYWKICRLFGDKRVISDTQFVIDDKEKI
jgi:hypothetical protein